MSHLDEGRLHALLDGELEENERREVEAHLATCAECRAACEEARSIFHEADALIATVDLPPAGAAVAPAVLPARARPRFRWQQVAWAATVVLAVGLGWMAKTDQMRHKEAAEILVAPPVAAPAPASSEAAGQAVPAELPARTNVSDDKLSSRTRDKAETAPSAAGKATNQVAAEREQNAPAQPAPAAAPAAPSNEAGALAQSRADTMASKDLADPAAPAGEPAEAVRLEARRAAPVPNATAFREESARGLAGAQGGRIAPRSLRTVAMEEAVRILGGSIRLVDGMTPTRILAGEANPAGGPAPYSLVRVVYDDPPGRELWLDQQRPAEADGDAGASKEGFAALLPGDTLVTLLNRGARSLRWLDQGGFRLGLTGFLPADSLRALARRVQ